MTYIIKDIFLICTENGIEISPTFLYSIIIGIVLFVVFVIVFIARNTVAKNSVPFFIPIGSIGLVTEMLPVSNAGTSLYQVKVNGEIWQAKSEHGEMLNINDEVEIISQEKNLLLLNVKKRGRT